MDSTTPPNKKPNVSTGSFRNLDLTGRTLDDFEIKRRLGRGGMGQVYLAEQISLKRRVALKILHPDLAADQVALERFRAEAEAVARITHPNIVQIYATGVADEIPFIALEYVEGRNLREFIEKKGTPELNVLIRIIKQVASAIQRAGELGIVHRDIKPDNILITRKAEAKVTDFGLSRIVLGDRASLNLTQTGVTLGTPLYMSPEQVEGKDIDIRSDIYSFGITCYFMMTGNPPFQGKSQFEVALQHVQDTPASLLQVRPDLPDLLCAIVHKMLAKEPADRYQTGGAILRDLSRLKDSLSKESNTPAPTQIMEHRPSDSTPSPTVPSDSSLPLPTDQGRSRGWLYFAVALSLFLALGSGVALAWWQHSRQQYRLPTVDGTDIEQLEAIVSISKREDALPKAVDQYLKPTARARNVTAGFALCLDLAMHYLENDRIDDAEKLFERLKKIGEVRSYYLLGKLGLGIVKSLKSQNKEEAEDANAIIVEVCAAVARELPGRRPFDRDISPELQMWRHPELRYWLAEAMFYNFQNGLPLSKVHPFLRRNKIPIPRPVN